MDWSSNRVFPRLALVVAVLLLATLVNWEVPARALGLDDGGPVCDWPDRPSDRSDPWLEVRLATCPRPDRPSTVEVWIHANESVRDVEAGLETSGEVADGSTTWTGDVPSGDTRLAQAFVDFSGRSRHEVRAFAQVTLPRDRGGYEEVPLGDTVAVELSPHCTLAYRGARPTGPWTCPR